MAAFDCLDTAASPVDEQASVTTLSMKEAFQKWLQSGKAKKHSPDAILSCMEKISDYALRNRISAGSLWDYRKPDRFKTLYNKLLEAKLLRIFDASAYKVFISAGKLYLRFLREKPWKENNVINDIAADKSEELPLSFGASGQADINPNEVVAWLITQPNANGTLYLENVAKSYMSALKNAPKKLILHDSVSRNVFSCHTVTDFNEVQKAFKSSENYSDINRNPWHGQFSAGLSAYKRYLEHLERDDIGKDVPVVQVRQSQAIQESSKHAASTGFNEEHRILSAFKSEFPISMDLGFVDFERLKAKYENLIQPFDTDEIASRLPIYPKHRIESVLNSGIEGLISINGNKFVHVDYVYIEQDDIEKIKTLITEHEATDGSMSEEDLYAGIVEEVPDVIEMNLEISKSDILKVIKSRLVEVYTIESG